jgi:hypothetical protein
MGFVGDNPYAEMTQEIVFGAINTFLEELRDTTGIDLTGFETLEGIPFDLLSSVLQGQGNWTALLSGTGVPNVTGLISLILNPVGAIQQFIPDFIPVSSIVDIAMNLLPDGLFGSSGSVGAGPWDWTDLFSTGTSLGSATTLHDGSLLQLFSDPPTKVVAGQNLNLTQAVRWEDIGAPLGSVFSLGVQLFDATMAPLGSVVNVADVVNPLNSSTSDPDADSNGFVPLGAGYTVPSGAAFLSQVLTVNPVATAGQSWWSNGSLSRSSLMPMSFVQDLPAQITSLFQQAQDMIDQGVQAILGGTGVNYLLSDWKIALQMIPGYNVLGAAGMPTMDTTITTMWDNVTSALRLIGLSGVSLSDFAAAAQDTSISANSANELAISQQNVLGNRTSNSVGGFLERTTYSNLRLADLGNGSSPTSVPVTQGNSAMTFLRMPNADTKGVVYWHSSGNTNITGFFINLGRMALDGTVTPIVSSGNLAAQLTSVGQFQQWVLPGVDKFVHNMSEVIVAEFQVTGSGTVNIAGTPQNSWMTTNHPVATTKRPGASRNTGAAVTPNPLSISSGTMNTLFNGNTPMVGLGRSDVPVSYVPPDIQKFSTTGTYTRPAWMVAGDILDIFLFPAGGGGESGGYGAPGEGGAAGQKISRSYVLGSDPKGTGFPVIPMSTTVFTHTLGAPGDGGFNPFILDPGSNAANSTVSAAGIATLIGVGGIGGGRSGNNWNRTTGQPAGNLAITDYTEFGGTEAGVNNSGVFPGGGGGSGYPAVGRAGAGAQVTYRARQAT